MEAHLRECIRSRTRGLLSADPVRRTVSVAGDGRPDAALLRAWAASAAAGQAVQLAAGDLELLERSIQARTVQVSGRVHTRAFDLLKSPRTWPAEELIRGGRAFSVPGGAPERKRPEGVSPFVQYSDSDALNAMLARVNKFMLQYMLDGICDARFRVMTEQYQNAVSMLIRAAEGALSVSDGFVFGYLPAVLMYDDGESLDRVENDHYMYVPQADNHIIGYNVTTNAREVYLVSAESMRLLFGPITFEAPAPSGGVAAVVVERFLPPDADSEDDEPEEAAGRTSSAAELGRALETAAEASGQDIAGMDSVMRLRLFQGAAVSETNAAAIRIGLQAPGRSSACAAPERTLAMDPVEVASTPISLSMPISLAPGDVSNEVHTHKRVSLGVCDNSLCVRRASRVGGDDHAADTVRICCGAPEACAVPNVLALALFADAVATGRMSDLQRALGPNGNKDASPLYRALLAHAIDADQRALLRTMVERLLSA